MRITLVVLLILFVVTITARKRKQKNNACYTMCDLSCGGRPRKDGCMACRKKCDASDESRMESDGIPSCKMMCDLFVCREDNADKCSECNKNCIDSNKNMTSGTNDTTQEPIRQKKIKRGKSSLGNQKSKKVALLRRILEFLNRILPIFGKKGRGGKNVMRPFKRNFRQPRPRVGPNMKPGKSKGKPTGYGGHGGKKGPGSNKKRPGKAKKVRPNGKSSKMPYSGRPRKWNKGAKANKPPKEPKMGSTYIKFGNRSNSNLANDTWPVQSTCAVRCAKKGACPRKVYFKQNQRKSSNECNLLLKEKCESSESMARCLLMEIENANGTCPKLTPAVKMHSKKCLKCVESCKETIRQSTCLGGCIAPDKCISKKERTDMMGMRTKNCLKCLRKNCLKKRMTYACILTASAAQCALHCPTPTEKEEVRSNVCTICRMECGKPGSNDEGFEMPPPVSNPYIVPIP